LLGLCAAPLGNVGVVQGLLLESSHIGRVLTEFIFTDMDSATYERPPQNLDPAAKDLIRGVYKLKDRLLLVLDEERTVVLVVGRTA
jgi:purine-binding chemotaxis protein CheW